MIAVTIVLLVILAVFNPINVGVHVKAYYSSNSIIFSARLFGIKVLHEHISLDNGLLNFNGSFTGNVELSKIVKENSSYLFKCISIKNIYVAFCKDIVKQKPINVVLENAYCKIFSSIFCAVSSKRLFVKHCLVNEQSHLSLFLDLNFNLAELSYLFVKGAI